MRTGDRLDVRTLDRVGDLLICECGRRYPIVDGVPIVMANPAAYMRAEIATVVERDLPPEVAAVLVEDGPDEATYPRLIEHLSIYLDAHWGDRALPALETFGMHAITEQIAKLPPVELAVELGCSVGRIAAELARNASRVIGIDLQFASVRRARRLLAGERLPYNRRVTGRHYATATAIAGDLATDRVTLFCADALDPPLLPAAFDRVVALNVIDSVRSPTQLLSVVDGLCAPDGELILSSPYAWQSSVMQEHERLGGADPAANLVAILRAGKGLGGRYEIEDEAELPWTLRRDARSTVSYRTHYVRARKLPK